MLSYLFLLIGQFLSRGLVFLDVVPFHQVVHYLVQLSEVPSGRSPDGVALFTDYSFSLVHALFVKIGLIFIDPQRLPGVYQLDGYVGVVRPIISDRSCFHEAFLGFHIRRVKEAVVDESLKALCHDWWCRWAVGDRSHGLNIVVDD